VTEILVRQAATPATSELRRHGDVMFLSLAGEIDGDTVRIVAPDLTAILVHPPRLLVIDLAKVTFMGSAGIALLDHLHACVVRGRRGHLRISRAAPCVRRIAEACDSKDVLTLLDVEPV
jgi:anti-anti-sigma factor